MNRKDEGRYAVYLLKKRHLSKSQDPSKEADMRMLLLGDPLRLESVEASGTCSSRSAEVGDGRGEWNLY